MTEIRKSYTFIGDDCPPEYRRVGTIDVADPADVRRAEDRGYRIGTIYDGRSYSCAEPCAADIYEELDDEPFPQPRRNDGGEPCGECHIQPGETCDICGAVNPTPAPISGGLDKAAITQHMQDFEAFVAKAAPKLHWKIYQVGADRPLHHGYYDGWQIGFGEEVFGPLPLPQLIDEMKASVTAKVRDLASEGSDNG